MSTATTTDLGEFRELAKIQHTFLGFEQGIFTAGLDIIFNATSTGRTVGGYRIAKVASEYIGRILQACGVEQWEALPGKTIYVLTNKFDQIIGIEHLPTEPGNRFLFSELFER